MKAKILVSINWQEVTDNRGQGMKNCIPLEKNQWPMRIILVMQSKGSHTIFF